MTLNKLRQLTRKPSESPKRALPTRPPPKQEIVDPDGPQPIPRPVALHSVDDELDDVIVGLDPSLCSFGLVAVTGKLCVLERQCLTEGKKMTGMKRIDYLINALLICVTRWKATARRVHVVREDFAYAASSSSDALLKHFGGALEYALHLKGVPLAYVPIASVKKFACGKGNAEKNVVMKEVFKQWGFDGNADESDAFAISATWAAYLNPEGFKLTATQKEVVAKLREGKTPLTLPTA